MRYDFNDLSMRIKANKKSFLIKSFVLLLIAITNLLLILLSEDGNLIIVSSVCLFIVFLLVEKLISDYNPKVLFSKEIKGRNVKEGEYEIIKRGSSWKGGMRYKQIGTSGGMQPFSPNTRANKKSFHKNLHFNGEVYLKTDNGEIKLISGLYPAHLEIYEDNDTLLKLAGAKFPVVINRELMRQPCPICGEINSDSEERCTSCGLKILH